MKSVHGHRQVSRAVWEGRCRAQEDRRTHVGQSWGTTGCGKAAVVCGKVAVVCGKIVARTSGEVGGQSWGTRGLTGGRGCAEGGCAAT